MSVFDPVIAAIDGTAALTGGFYHAQALKDASPPFGFWIQDAEETAQTLGGYTELQSGTFDVHIVSKYLAELDRISSAVKLAVVSLQGQTVSNILFERINLSQISPILHEREVNLYRKVYHLQINYQEIPVSDSDTGPENNETEEN